MQKTVAGLLSGVMMLAAGAVHAAGDKGGITLSGTRVVFDGNKEAATLGVTNGAAQDVWLMRFWVSPYHDEATQAGTTSPKAAAAVPFVVTPPLWRLDPGGTVQLRINPVAQTLPADRESVYWLNSLSIPPKKGSDKVQKAVQSGLTFAVNTRIKLFYRPAALNDAAAVRAAPEKLQVTGTGKAVVVNNPTPYYVVLTRLMLNGAPVNTDQDTMIAPFGTLSLAAAGVTHGRLGYRTVNDAGMTSELREKTF